MVAVASPFAVPVKARQVALQSTLSQWLRLFAMVEAARASRDPYAYARMKERVGKQREPVRKQRDDDLQYFDRNLRALLLRYGLREAAENANRAAGRVLIPESLIQEAIDNKPVKIKWFWELRNGLVQRVEDISDATRNEARESVRRIIRASREETRPDGTPVQPSVGEIARRIRSAWTAPTGARGEEVEPERALRVQSREGGREFVFSAERAAIIARTELAQMENSGTYQGYVETGAEWLEWHAYSDGRSGDRHHERMNGKRVRVGQMFTMPDGAKMRYPADPLGPIRHGINCRCSFSVADGPPPKG